MKKIGIVTILDNNLGNRLQNFALQEILKELDCTVETIQKGKKTAQSPEL